MLYCHVRKGYPTRMAFEYTTSMRNPPLFSHEWCSHRRDVAIVEIVSNCLLEASKRFEHKQNVMHTDLSKCLSLIFCLTSNCLCLKQLLASNCYFLCIRPIVCKTQQNWKFGSLAVFARHSSYRFLNNLVFWSRPYHKDYKMSGGVVRTKYVMDQQQIRLARNLYDIYFVFGFYSTSVCHDAPPPPHTHTLWFGLTPLFWIILFAMYIYDHLLFETLLLMSPLCNCIAIIKLSSIRRLYLDDIFH